MRKLGVMNKSLTIALRKYEVRLTGLDERLQTEASIAVRAWRHGQRDLALSRQANVRHIRTRLMRLHDKHNACEDLSNRISDFMEDHQIVAIYADFGAAVQRYMGTQRERRRELEQITENLQKSISMVDQDQEDIGMMRAIVRDPETVGHDTGTASSERAQEFPEADLVADLEAAAGASDPTGPLNLPLAPTHAPAVQALRHSERMALELSG